MFIKKCIIFILFMIWGVSCYGASAPTGLVFESNFDTIPDWNTDNSLNVCISLPCANAPTGWSAYYSNLSDPSGTLNKSLLISTPPSGPDHTGPGTGKALMAYYSNVYWSSGGSSEITKILNQDYPYLYLQVWVKTQPNFYWGNGSPGGNSADAVNKLFRMAHWDRTGSPYDYFPTGVSAPMALVMIGRNETYMPNNSTYTTAYRCDPQATNYYSCGGYFTDLLGNISRQRDTDWDQYLFTAANGKEPNVLGSHSDGNWHRWNMYVQMNSSTSNTDGIWKVWYDGTLVHDDESVQWVFPGGDAITGWNSVQFGGNSNNTNAPNVPQWIAFDDVVVSTTPIDPLYVPGGGTTDATPPVISTFTIPSTSSSLTINITSLVATDNIAVTGYLINESPTIPSVSDSGWTSNIPTTYTFTTTGAKTLYAWAKDATGNISTSLSANTTITIAGVIPQTPANLNATVISGSEIDLTWTAY